MPNCKLNKIIYNYPTLTPIFIISHYPPKVNSFWQKKLNFLEYLANLRKMSKSCATCNFVVEFVKFLAAFL